MTEKLLPCPFCGGNAFSCSPRGHTFWQTTCLECHAGTPVAFANAALSEAAWNRRSSGYDTLVNALRHADITLCALGLTKGAKTRKMIDGALATYSVTSKESS